MYKERRLLHLKEEIIKSKLRVQKHGEVFTPKKIVNKMLNTPGVKEACENLTATFLEPSAGEGAFLLAILERKLRMVREKHNNDLATYENYSLFVLTTLYGIELLEDNAQRCVMNMFQLFYDHYQDQVDYHNGRMKKRVLDSAKEIISSNIRQGNFLTRLSSDGTPLIFSEWSPLNLRKTTKNIKVQRTEYTLDDIDASVKKEAGTSVNNNVSTNYQLDLFSIEEIDESLEQTKKTLKYTPVKIVDIYKEEMEEED